jgi:hypothetical protein
MTYNKIGSTNGGLMGSYLSNIGGNTSQPMNEKLMLQEAARGEAASRLKKKGIPGGFFSAIGTRI